MHVHEFRSRTLKNFSIEYHIIKSIVVVELKSLLFFTCFEILSFCTFVNIMDIIFASVSNKGPLFLKLMAFSQYSVLLQTISKIQVPKSKKSQHRLYCNCLTDRFSISCKRWEPPFLGFCRNLVPWGLLGRYLGVKNIFSLSLLIWAWGHTLYFSLQCKTNPMIVIADFFQTRVIFII